MLREMLVIAALSGYWAFATDFVLAADQEGAQQPAQTQKQEQIYDSPLMSEQECIEYRAKIRAAKTAEEREQIRKEHHERMKELSQGAW